MLCIYFWLCWVFVDAHRLSLVAERRGLLFTAVRMLLIVVASLAVELGLWGARVAGVAVRRFSGYCVRTLELRLSSCGAQA